MFVKLITRLLLLIQIDYIFDCRRENHLFYCLFYCLFNCLFNCLFYCLFDSNCNKKFSRLSSNILLHTFIIKIIVLTFLLLMFHNVCKINNTIIVINSN